MPNMNSSNSNPVYQTADSALTQFTFETTVFPNGTATPAAIVDHNRYISPLAQLIITSVYIVGFSANACSLALLNRPEQIRNQKLILMVKCLVTNDMMALCSSFLLVYMRLYLSHTFLATRWFCGLRVLTRFFGFSSGSVASVMALDRFVALTMPFFYQKHVTHKLVRRAILVQWCLVMLVVLLPLGGFGLYYHVNLNSGHPSCARYRQATEPTDIVYAYLMFGFGTTMCLVIVFCNLAVVVALCRLSPHQKVMRTTSGEGRISNHATHEELSFARLMVALCIFFVACWLPQMMTILMAQANPSLKRHPFFSVADALTALHFILDPIVYVLSRRPHRRGLRRFLKPLCQRCWTTTTLQSQDSNRTTPSNSQKHKQQPNSKQESWNFQLDDFVNDVKVCRIGHQGSDAV